MKFPIPSFIKQYNHSRNHQSDAATLPIQQDEAATRTTLISDSDIYHQIPLPPQIIIAGDEPTLTYSRSSTDVSQQYHHHHYQHQQHQQEQEPIYYNSLTTITPSTVNESSSSVDMALVEKNTHDYRHRHLPLGARIKKIVKSRMAFRPPVPHDPRLFSKSRKRWILACLALGSSLNGFCSTIYFPGIPDITEQFGASDIEVTLTTSLFMLFGGIGPILWASMSDHYHIRRFLYLNSLLIFSVASIGCAISVNVYMLLVLRCIQSIGTSVTISVGAGTISDCWAITERGAAFSVLFVGQFLGPLIGPVLGGGLTTLLGWRSTFWFCTGYGLFLFFFLFTFLPETYRVEGKFPDIKLPSGIGNNHYSSDVNVSTPLASQTVLPTAADATIIAREDAEASTIAPTIYSGSIREPPTAASNMTAIIDNNNRNSESHYYVTMEEANNSSTDISENNSKSKQSDPAQQRMNPFASVLLLRHLFIFMIALGTGIIFGTMFTIETVIPSFYETTYGFESWETGLSYLGAGIGNLLGSIVSGWFSDHLIKRAREKRGGTALTEDRLTMNTWPGFVLVPLGVLIFGWSLVAHFTVWVSIIGFAVVCFGMSQVYTAGSAYLVDALPGKGASVTGASNLMRMSMACVLSLIAQPLADSIGPGFLSVVLAGFNVLAIALFLLVKLKGQSMRERAGYGNNYE